MAKTEKYGDTLKDILSIKPDAKGEVKQDKNNNMTKKGLKEGFTRSTLIVNEDHLTKLKIVSFNDGVSLKEVVEAAFGRFINEYETANGKIKQKKQGLRLQ